MQYTVTYEGKTYTLDSEGCGYFANDEETPIEGIGVEGILEALAQSDMVVFDREYYDQACVRCDKNRQDSARHYEYLECHFYLFAKGQTYVMSSLSLAYEYATLPDLLKAGTVDASYIVSINVCPVCGDYTIELEYGLW